MKVTKTVALEEEPQPKLMDKKAKGKAKAKEKGGAATAERDKQEKAVKEKVRRSLTRDKRKMKEELPELLTHCKRETVITVPRTTMPACKVLICETKYFDVIEKEKEKYEFEEDIALKPSMHLSIAIKKEKKDEVPKTSKSDEQPKRKSKERKSKIRRTIEKEEDVIVQELEADKSKDLQKSFAETIKEDTLETKRRISRRKIKRHPKKAVVSLKLPRPCKPEVCRPKVCCFYTDLRTRREKELKRVRTKREIDTLERESTTVKDEIDRKKRKEDESNVSMMSRSTIGSGKEYSKKHMKMEKVSAIHEMMAPPTELVKDVERAKKELREALGVTKKKKKRRRKYVAGKRPKSKYARAFISNPNFSCLNKTLTFSTPNMSIEYLLLSI